MRVHRHEICTVYDRRFTPQKEIIPNSAFLYLQWHRLIHTLEYLQHMRRLNNNILDHMSNSFHGLFTYLNSHTSAHMHIHMWHTYTAQLKTFYTAQVTGLMYSYYTHARSYATHTWHACTHLYLSNNVYTHHVRTKTLLYAEYLQILV